jgi:protein TonB
MTWFAALLAWTETGPALEKWAIPPRAITGSISNADYPREALRDGAEGRVEALLSIDSAGIVSSCIIKRSSGNKLLDAQTCKLVRSRYRFEPARNSDGQPISVQAILPVEWKIW